MTGGKGTRPIRLRDLVLASLLTALEVVTLRLVSLYFYLPPGTFMVRVSPQFALHGVCGWLLGPWAALGSATAADLLGTFLNPTGTGSFFAGYTLSAALGGLIYGLFLCKKPPSFWRCAAAVLTQTVLCGILLGALWSSVTSGKLWLAVVWAQTPIRLSLVVPYALALYGLQKLLAPAAEDYLRR